MDGMEKQLWCNPTILVAATGAIYIIICGQAVSKAYKFLGSQAAS